MLGRQRHGGQPRRGVLGLRPGYSGGTPTSSGAAPPFPRSPALFVARLRAASSPLPECRSLADSVGSFQGSPAAASSDFNSSTGRRASLTKWPRSLAILDDFRGPKTTSTSTL